MPIVQRLLALMLLVLLGPLWLVLYILVKRDSRGAFIFKQTRMGKNKQLFTIYKIRTMVMGAESQQSQLRRINEADGPLFKIKNDPRFTRVGRYLARFGLDELPQLWNIVRGEMAFVGPRPFPVKEAQKIADKYIARFSVLPGITSMWIMTQAGHQHFHQWMNTDLEYVELKSLGLDIKIIMHTILKLWFRQ